VGADGSQLGIMHPLDALRVADGQGLDLVEIAPTAQPPVCKIMDFGKYKYELDQKQKEARKKQIHVKVKEVKFHPNVEDHDYQTKLRHIKDFIEESNRVRCSLQFRGRETSHTDLGFMLFNRIVEDVKEIAHPESRPQLQGRLLSMNLVPNKTAHGAITPVPVVRSAFGPLAPRPLGSPPQAPRPPAPGGRP
jgi:translation initiation factor IF-3